MIDFGQSSTPKLSLRPFLNKQEVPMPIAQDMAQAIQVAGNAGKMFSQVEEEAQQARHFNALTAFNNIRSQQQDEMLAAGNDLNAQRQVLDKYKTDFASLQSIYGLNEKYSADLSTKIEGHTSAWEEHYRGKYNAQQEGIADTNIAETINSMMTVGVSKDDITTTLSALKEYRKQMTGSSDERTTASKIADIFGNARITSMDKDTLTFKQARDNKNETLSILEEFDPRITTTAEYRKIKDAFDYVEEKKRVDEANTFEKTLKEAHVTPKEAAKAIAVKVAEGIVKPEHAALMLLTAKNNYEDREAILRNRAEAEANKKENAAEKELKLLFFQLANNEVPLEESKTLLYDKATSLGIDTRYADHYIDTLKKPIEAAIAKKQVNFEKEKIGNLLENKVITHDGKEVSPEEFKASVINAYGVYGQEQQSKYNAYKIQYLALKSPEMFADTPKASWGVHDNDAAAVAPLVAQQHLVSGNISKVAKLAESYGGANLKLSEFFGNGFRSKDPATFNATMTAYGALRQALPNSYDDIMGKELAIEMGIMQTMLEKSGKQVPDERTWTDVEHAVKNPVDYNSRPYTAAKESLTTFMNKRGITNRSEIYHKMDGLIKMGAQASDAASFIQDSYKKLDIGNPNVDIFSYGKEVDSFTKDVLNKGTEYIKELSAGAVTGYVYNPATKSVWYSTDTNKYAYRTNESLEEFTKNLHANMIVHTNKINKEFNTSYEAGLLDTNPAAITRQTTGTAGRIKDILLPPSNDEADKKRLKRIVTGRSE